MVVKASDEASGSKKFGHAIVAGIDRYPRRVVRAMSQKKVDKKCKIKPFLKTVNLSHIMPTRYNVDLDLKKMIGEESLSKDAVIETRKQVKKLFEEKYKSQDKAKTDKKAAAMQYFFSKLRF